MEIKSEKDIDSEERIIEAWTYEIKIIYKIYYISYILPDNLKFGMSQRGKCSFVNDIRDSYTRNDNGETIRMQ